MYSREDELHSYLQPSCFLLSYRFFCWIGTDVAYEATHPAPTKDAEGNVIKVPVQIRNIGGAILPSVDQTPLSLTPREDNTGVAGTGLSAKKVADVAILGAEGDIHQISAVLRMRGRNSILIECVVC